MVLRDPGDVSTQMDEISPADEAGEHIEERSSSSDRLRKSAGTAGENCVGIDAAMDTLGDNTVMSQFFAIQQVRPAVGPPCFHSDAVENKRQLRS